MASKNQKTTAAQLEKKVRLAADELEKEGQRITNPAVREKLGGGSFRDITPIVKAINAEKEARTKAESQVPDMPEDVAELSTAIWEAAYRAADEVAAADRRTHAEEIKGLRAEVSECKKDTATVEEELDDALARAEGAEAANAELEARLIELRLAVAGLEGQLLGRREATPKEGKEPNTAASGHDDPQQTSLFDYPAGDGAGMDLGNNADHDGRDHAAA
tara:strand:- start:3210 stop:3866 length:657 start_codon:yes stop_codon:yes gene_type:complete